MSETETFRQPDKVDYDNMRTETLHDGDYLAIIARLESSPIEEEMKNHFKMSLKAAIRNTELLQGEERMKFVTNYIQKLYEDKNEYCKTRHLSDSPELQEVIVEINFYLQKLLSDLTIKRALEHSQILSKQKKN